MTYNRRYNFLRIIHVSYSSLTRYENIKLIFLYLYFDLYSVSNDDEEEEILFCALACCIPRVLLIRPNSRHRAKNIIIKSLMDSNSYIVAFKC